MLLVAILCPPTSALAASASACVHVLVCVGVCGCACARVCVRACVHVWVCGCVMVCFDTRMSQEVKSSRGGASEEFELKLWQSILSESQPVTGRDDVFQWRGVSLNVVYVFACPTLNPFNRELCVDMSVSMCVRVHACIHA